MILFRKDYYSSEECEIAKKYFSVETIRSRINYGRNVIGRYSVLPFYKELEEDLAYNNSKLINSFHQHRYIANFDWYDDLKDFTPRTWFSGEEASKVFDSLKHGMFIKGRTNSKKSLKLSLAKTRQEFNYLDWLLSKDEFIANQGLVYREYLPLEIIEETIVSGEHNFVNEWRVFFYGDKIVDCGYYWSMISDEKLDLVKEPDVKMLELANEVAKIVSKKVKFYVVDFAKTVDGKWIVVELNDGQMSGLSMIPPDRFYQNLANVYYEENNE